jgi:predicted esterase
MTLLPPSAQTETTSESVWLSTTFAGQWRFALRPAREADAPMVIAVHGSDRDTTGLLGGFDALGDSVSLLVPEFPQVVAGQDIGDDYKFLIGNWVNYLDLLDAMRRDAAAQLNATPRATYLFGFSGGAQFVHRYALFRGQSIDGFVAASPGSVTLLRKDVEWWPGLRGADAMGEMLDIEAMDRLRIAFLVGDQDRKAGLVSRPAGSTFGSDFADLAGANRIERTRALAESFSNAGLSCEFQLIPGAGHELAPCAGAAADILCRWLDNINASAISTENWSGT